MHAVRVNTAPMLHSVYSYIKNIIISLVNARIHTAEPIRLSKLYPTRKAHILTRYVCMPAPHGTAPTAMNGGSEPRPSPGTAANRIVQYISMIDA